MTTSDGPSVGGEYLVVDSPYEVANWRPLVHWIMYVPHALIVRTLQSASFVIFVIYWVALIATGRLHRGMYGFMAMVERYSNRSGGFLVGYTEEYAPFEFEPRAADDGAYPPIRVDLPEPPESTPRTAAFNWIFAIPHYIVIMIIAIGAFFVLIAGWFAVLFTGAWPRGIRDFLVRFANYYLRVWVYVTMVETRYPRFSLSSG